MGANRLLCWCHHATLAMASLCLVVSLDPFVPEVQMYLWPLPLLFLGAALFREGWALSNRLANVCGTVAAALGLGWLWRGIQNTDSVIYQVGFPTTLVPYAAVGLAILTLLIALRARSPRDFWYVQGLGLVHVAVACTLAGPPTFGLVLFGYLACALACLRVHYQAEQAEGASTARRISTSPGADGDPAEKTRHRVAVPAAVRTLARTSVTWAAGLSALVILLSLVTPRYDTFWDPYTRFGLQASGVQVQTGYVEEIDLSQTGAIELNDAVAFTVHASDARGQPKDDLPADQRWRGAVLDVYENGKWRSAYRSGSVSSGFRRGDRTLELPDLGPEQFFLSFHVDVLNAGGMFLAEPITVGPARELPVVSENTGRRGEQLFDRFMGTVLPRLQNASTDCRYKQVVARDAEDNGRPLRNPLFWSYLIRLQRNHVSELEAWSRELLERLAREGKYGLTRKDLEADVVEPAGISAAAGKIAHAVCNYLATSGDYQYTLDLQREDAEVDPVLDFLHNVKQGHCERFAAALALLLRAQAIPARLVKGFRGLDAQGDGKYVVRQLHAHSWVEAFVPVLVEGSDTVRFGWLSLDPTPFFEVPPSPAPSTVESLLESLRNLDLLWKNLVVDFNQENQILLVRSAESWWPLLVLASAFGAVWLIRRRRRAKIPTAPLAFFARLVALLARHGGPVLQRAQTPREYAAAAATFLMATPAQPLADVPGEAARLLYRVRFADQPLTAQEGDALTARLSELAVLLKETASCQRDPR